MEKHIEFTKKVIEKNIFYKKYFSKCENEIFNDTFSFLPTLDKKTVQANYKELVCLDIKKDYEIIETSGTTGIPMRIFWYKNEFIKSNLYTWYLRQKWYGILPNMKFCTFHSCATNLGNSELVDAIITNDERTLSLGRYVYNEYVLSSYIKLIGAFQAKWILGPSSVLQILSRYMLDNHIELTNIVYIELNGEFVDSEALTTIKLAFPNAIISNLYGSTEFNGIAFTCPYGNMHVLEKNVYLETIYEHGLPNIYITGLVNSAMPLIRYNIGDIGTTEESNCACGNKSLILNLKGARLHELMLLENICIDPAIFNNIIYDLNNENFLIFKFQIRIKNNSDIELVLLIKETDNSTLERQKIKIINKLKKFNKNLNCSIRFIFDEKEILNCKNKFTYVYYD